MTISDDDDDGGGGGGDGGDTSLSHNFPMLNRGAKPRYGVLQQPFLQLEPPLEFVRQIRTVCPLNATNCHRL